MDNYKKVNILEYVKEGLKNGSMMPHYATKKGLIKARIGIVDEKIITWSVDNLGNSIEEKVDVVKVDSETNKPDWVVTKVDSDGNVIIDKNGKTNDWIIKDSIFTKKYEQSQDDLFKPKSLPQLFVEINDNIILNQWGSEMKMAKGGYINITNLNDIYGISQRDFTDTYEFIESKQNIIKNA